MLKISQKSFTLLEVILAITVLTIATGGSFILISQIIASSSIAQSRLTAAYLTQEGIELVKNIRDNNWLQGNDWDEGLGGETEDTYYEADSNRYNLIPCVFSCATVDLRFLKISDFYNYDFGDPTIFKRKITISKEVDKPFRLKVSVEVFWTDKGETYPSIVAQEYLYNWK